MRAGMVCPLPLVLYIGQPQRMHPTGRPPVSKLQPAPVTTQMSKRPSRAEAEEAVRTLLAWSGDDPEREGLRETPKRVVEAYLEYFNGYDADPAAELAKTFEDTAGYDDMVLLKDIRLMSFCEHHIAPFFGVAHVAYVPDKRIVGLSKLAKVVEIFSHRLQTQETLTAEIASAIEKALTPKGVAILISAEHTCMSMRGVRQPGVATITTRFTGIFNKDASWRDRFLNLCAGRSSA